MRLMREHYGPAEKQAGYDCIRDYIGRASRDAGAPGEFGKPGDMRNIGYAFKTFFSNFAWPGGYTVEFIDDDGNVYCADCAKRVFIMDRKDITAGTYDEGPTETCCDCGREIESSYGDPDAPDNE